MKRVQQDDVFCAKVPDGIDPADKGQRALLILWLEQQSRFWVAAQWGGAGPARIEYLPSEWLITCTVADVDGFQPAHGCAACLAGNDQARAFLAANPGRWLAMANLRYVEYWDD